MSEPGDVKYTWQVEGEPQVVHTVTMCSPPSRPCNCQCPWLVANHGTAVELFYDHEVPGIPMPAGEFTFAPWKRAHLWEQDLKHGAPGYGGLCHVRLQGTQARPGNAWDVVARQCAGALVMQQRELLRHVARGESALTPQGAARVASDLLGREVAERELGELDVRQLLAHAHPSLLDPQVGSDAVAPPLSEREILEWGTLRSAASCG